MFCGQDPHFYFLTWEGIPKAVEGRKEERKKGKIGLLVTLCHQTMMVITFRYFARRKIQSFEGLPPNGEKVALKFGGFSCQILGVQRGA